MHVADAFLSARAEGEGDTLNASHGLRGGNPRELGYRGAGLDRQAPAPAPSRSHTKPKAGLYPATSCLLANIHGLSASLRARGHHGCKLVLWGWHAMTTGVAYDDAPATLALVPNRVSNLGRLRSRTGPVSRVRSCLALENAFSLHAAAPSK